MAVVLHFAFCILSCCGCERWVSRNLLHLELDLWYCVLVMRVHLTEKEYTRKRTKIGQFYKISERSLDSTRNITISRLVFFVRGCAKNYCPLEVSHVTLLPGNKTVDISNSLQSSCLWRYLHVFRFSFFLCSALIVTCSKVQMYIMWIFTIISVITLASFKSLARKLFVVIFVFFHCFPTL